MKSFALSLLFCLAGFAAFSEMKAEFMPVVKNNVCNSITALEQDDYGFMWVGTTAGLARFDGYSYRWFHFGEDEPLAMLGGMIRTLSKDQHGNIWISAEQCAAVYLAREDRFVAIQGGIGTRRISTFSFTPDGHVVAGTISGIALIDSATFEGNMLNDELNPDISHAKYVVSAVDPAGNVWLAGNDRFVRLTFDGEKVVTRQWLRHQQVGFLRVDPWGRLWFNDGENIYIAEPPEGDGEFLPHLVFGMREASSMVFLNGEAWIGTGYAGFYHLLLDAHGTVTETETHWINPASRNNLHNLIGTLFVDRNGRIWLGTLDGMFILAPRHYNPFHVVNETAGLSHNVVSDLCQDAAGNVWASTSDGLNKLVFKPTGVDITKFSNNLSDRMPVTDNRLQNMIVDNRNRIWIGTKRRVVMFDPSAGQFFTNPYLARLLSPGNNDYSKSFCKDTLGNIYMGFVSGGVVVWESSRDSVYRMEIAHPDFLTSGVRAIARDRQGNLWIDSRRIGLFRIASSDIGPGKIEHYRLYPYSPQSYKAGAMGYMNVLTVCRDGTLLAGASNGLYRYRPATESFERIKLNFLDKNEYVCSITEDNENCCWVFTTTGVYRYRPGRQEFPFYFELNDGAFARMDYANGSFLSREGRIFAGGINGVTWFDPAEVRCDTTEASIHISNFTILNHNVKPDGIHLDENINSARRVNIFHNDAQFSFEFTTFDYAKPQQVRYCYRLEGYTVVRSHEDEIRSGGCAARAAVELRGVDGEACYSFARAGRDD